MSWKTQDFFEKEKFLLPSVMFPKLWDSVIEKQGDSNEGMWTYNLKELKVLIKNIVCITFEMASVLCSLDYSENNINYSSEF